MKKLIATFLTLVLVITLLPINALAAKKITISHKSLNMITGDTFNGLYLKNSYIKSAKSSNKKVVSVNEYGDLKAHKSGTATITLKDYNKKSYKCKVKVYSKKTVESNITSERITFKNDDETETWYLLTNNNPLALDLYVKITGKKLTGDIEANETYIFGLPKNGKYLIYAGYLCTSATFKYDISASTRKDYSSYVDIKLKNQTSDGLITVKNNSDKPLSIYLISVCYNSNNEPIDVLRNTFYTNAHETDQENFYYTTYEREFVDEDGYRDTEYVYNVPDRYDTYYYAILDD